MLFLLLLLFSRCLYTAEEVVSDVAVEILGAVDVSWFCNPDQW
jgi:hypothetical protein